MKVVQVSYFFVVAAVCGALQASEHFKGYDTDRPQIPQAQTPRAIEYERAYSKDAKERATGFYNRLKSALGFKSSASRPRVAEYEKAFSTYDYKNEPWNTPWYEKRTYEEPLPDDVKKLLDTHQEELKKVDSVESFEWLPGYMVKEDYPYRRYIATDERIPGDASRIKGAKIFTRDIKAQRNPMIYVPQKYEYTLTSLEKPEGGVGDDYIISEKVPISDEPITKEEAKTIEKTAYRTKWTDPHSRNVVKMAPGRIAIIDTELSFNPALKRNALKTQINTKMLEYPSPFSSEAIDYLKNKQMQLQYKQRGWYSRVPPSRKDFYSRMGL